MKIHLTRDSVCAGDDADAPHTRTMQFSDEKSLETVIEEIARSGYLASIAGGKATWSVVADRPIAVIAQQWLQPKFLPGPFAPLSIPQSADGLARLHFRYHLQEDPNSVYSSLAGDRGVGSVWADQRPDNEMQPTLEMEIAARRSIWISLAKFIAFAPLCIPALVGLLAPDDVLSTSPVARGFVETQLPVFPYVKGHASSTSFGGAATLAHLLSCVIVLCSSAALALISVFDYERMRLRFIQQRTSRKAIKIIVFQGPFIIALVHFCTISMAGDPSWATGLTTHSRIGFSFMKFCADFTAMVILGG